MLFVTSSINMTRLGGIQLPLIMFGICLLFLSGRAATAQGTAVVRAGSQPPKCINQVLTLYSSMSTPVVSMLFP